MRGSQIIVSAPTSPRGVFMEGIIGAGLTPKPGTLMQLQPATALVGGRHTWELYNGDINGGRPKGPLIILTEDHLQGRDYSTAYAAGERCFGYVPVAGEEFNLLVANITGTADDHAKGEILIPSTDEDATKGKLIATTGSPEIEPFQLLETITDPTADTLSWVVYTGY